MSIHSAGVLLEVEIALGTRSQHEAMRQLGALEAVAFGWACAVQVASARDRVMGTSDHLLGLLREATAGRDEDQVDQVLEEMGIDFRPGYLAAAAIVEPMLPDHELEQRLKRIEAEDLEHRRLGE